ncbi:MAG: VWA domain-containing protein [Rhodospirillales bacterium]
MRLPASASLSEVQGLLSQLGPLGMLGGAIFGQVAGGPTRLEAAKRGVNGVVASMPGDVDVGLVTLRRCPNANNEGFFSSTERNRLYARVNALSPMEGTPLAQGIMQAGQMIDGVKAPAVMVVISDGDDSCGGDPCAAAQALRQSKPLLKINVVDILGNGSLSCLARATGGQVLKPGDGVAFEKAIKQAAQDAIKPAYCH